MKPKTHWLRNTLIVMICCGILGTALSAVFYLRNENRSYAEAILQFSFNGAGEGKAPNGVPFDVNGIFTEEVFSEALKANSLEGIYTADQLADNLQITGVYPENIVNQMTQYVSLLNTGSDREASVSSYHATIFEVRLYNDFDKSFTGGKLTGLLTILLDACRNRFSKTSSGVLTAGLIQNLDQYDLPQQLTVLMGEVSQQNRHAEEISNLAPDFRQDNIGFNDLKVQYQSLYSELQRTYGLVTMGALSRDSESLRKLYEEKIWELKTRADKKKEELRQIENLEDNYQKDSVVYVSTSNALRRIGSDTSAYDQLSVRRDQLTAEVAALQKEAASYESLLKDITWSPESLEELGLLPTDTRKEQTAAAAEQISSLANKLKAINAEFSSLLDGYTKREINERTVSVTQLKYKSPSLFSLAFVKAAVKTAGPLCMLGLMVCLVLLIRARRKEEKA